jgi:uncharacterized protein YecT (DUF1311 family)
MKYLLLVAFFASAVFSFSQEVPMEVTPEMIVKIKADIEAEIPAVKKQLQEEERSEKDIEYALDTFKIEQLAARRMDIDYSTYGMKEAMSELMDGYDVLLNKYYNLLMKSLISAEDKQTLKTAQKAWLAYRDAEKELMWTMRDDEYSGGGTIQGLIGMGDYLDFIQTRTETLFYYYSGIVQFDE